MEQRRASVNEAVFELTGPYTSSPRPSIDENMLTWNSQMRKEVEQKLHEEMNRDIDLEILKKRAIDGDGDQKKKVKKV